MSSKVSRLRTALIVLSALHLTFMILYFVAGALMMGIMELMCGWVLLYTICSLSYGLIAMYVMIVGIDLITAFASAGIHVQHDKLYGWDQYRFIVFVLALFLYFFAFFIGLSAYREFRYATTHPEAAAEAPPPSYMGASREVGQNDNDNTNASANWERAEAGAVADANAAAAAKRDYSALAARNAAL